MISTACQAGWNLLAGEVLPKNRTGVIATQPDEENTHVQRKRTTSVL